MSHDQIWAPWRLAYIKGEKPDLETPSGKLDFLPGADPECFLCQAVGDRADRQRHVVHRGPRTVTVLNRYPYNNGHLLVAPIAHKARLDELTPAEHVGLAEVTTQMVGLLEDLLQPDGFNVGLNLGRAAGAGLPGHLHWHIVPRWNGDTNFMPSVAAVKVIPQSLDDLWQVLTDALAGGDAKSPGR